VISWSARHAFACVPWASLGTLDGRGVGVLLEQPLQMAARIPAAAPPTHVFALVTARFSCPHPHDNRDLLPGCRAAEAPSRSALRPELRR
jgi:hypothetical protein